MVHTLLRAYADATCAMRAAQPAGVQQPGSAYADLMQEASDWICEHVQNETTGAMMWAIRLQSAAQKLRASHGQAPAQHTRPCVVCGSDEPFTGTCGSRDPRALCKQPTPSPQPDSVQEDAACWHWLAEYLVGTRTDLDDEIVASETVNDLRKLVKAARKQGANHGR